jgi:hypothetical protein
MFFPGRGEAAGGVKLTPYIYIVPRLRMSWTIPLFRPNALMAWAETSPMMMMIMIMMIIIIIVIILKQPYWALHTYFGKY